MYSVISDAVISDAVISDTVISDAVISDTSNELILHLNVSLLSGKQII